MSFSVIDADRLAERLHNGQVDKSGTPYIEHPRAVERLATALGADDQQRIAALLHDVLEDTDCTMADLVDRGVPDRARRIVEAMTHRAGESRRAYLERVTAEPAAVLVKAADVLHNTDPERLAQLDPAAADRLRAKYLETFRALVVAALAP